MIDLEKLAVQSLVQMDTGLADGPEVIFSKEVFAQLVARECMHLCLTTVGNGDYNRGRLDCHDNIREVFGIK